MILIICSLFRSRSKHRIEEEVFFEQKMNYLSNIRTYYEEVSFEFDAPRGQFRSRPRAGSEPVRLSFDMFRSDYDWAAAAAEAASAAGPRAPSSSGGGDSEDPEALGALEALEAEAEAYELLQARRLQDAGRAWAARRAARRAELVLLARFPRWRTWQL